MSQPILYIGLCMDHESLILAKVRAEQPGVEVTRLPYDIVKLIAHLEELSKQFSLRICLEPFIYTRQLKMILSQRGFDCTLVAPGRITSHMKWDVLTQKKHAIDLVARFKSGRLSFLE